MSRRCCPYLICIRPYFYPPTHRLALVLLYNGWSLLRLWLLTRRRRLYIRHRQALLSLDRVLAGLYTKGQVSLVSDVRVEQVSPVHYSFECRQLPARSAAAWL
jgi:hypothetical protein